MRITTPFKLCLFILGWISIFPIDTLSQKYIHGVITDSSGKFISSASVSIINVKTEVGINFTQSNEKGAYRFILPDSLFATEIAVRVNAIGFHKSVKTIRTSNSIIDFILQEDIKELPKLTVKNTTHIRIKGDTLNYVASDFIDKSDRSIADVLRKIPGVEIDDNGTIKYQGKAINYFYIDGDNILDDKYTIATKNLPPDIVEKIQLIENNQHIKMLNGIVPSVQPGINITLKDKAKTNFIQTAKLGAGNESTKDFELNSLAFRSKFKAINILKYNNFGIDPAVDVISHNAIDFANTLENNGTENLINLGLGGNPPIQKNRFLFNNASLININDFLKTKKELSLRVNASYISDTQDYSYNFLSTYYLPADTIRYTEQQNINRNLRILHIVVNTNINTTNKYLNNSITVDYNTNFDNAQLVTNNKPVLQNLNGSIKKISNNLNGIKLMSNGRFFEYFSFIEYDKKPQDFFVAPGLHAAFLNNNQPFAQTIQQASVPTFFTNNYISYKKSKNNLFQNYKAGFLLQNAVVNSALFLKQNNNAIASLSDSFSNQLNWNKNKIYTEAEFRLEEGKSSIRVLIPAGYYSIKYIDTILQKRSGFNGLIVTPSIIWKYKAGIENIVSASYNYSNRLSSVGEVFPGIIMENYQSFISNDIPIQQTHTHTYSAGFDFKRSVKLLFINLTTNYTERKAAFIYSSILQNNIMLRFVEPIENTRYLSSVSASISKYLFNLKTNIFARYAFQLSQSQQLQNKKLFPIAYFSNYVTAGFTAKPHKNLSLNYESFHSWSFSQPGIDPMLNFIKQNIYNSRQMLELMIFPSDRYSIKFRNEYYFNTQTGQKASSFLFSNATIRYRLKNNTTDLEFSCLNITNTSLFSTLYVSENSISESNYFLRPRTILLRISFRF